MEIITKQLDDVSNGLIKPAIDPNGAGVHVLSSARPIKRGDLILSCHASAIAFDPPHRQKRCAYCAVKLAPPNNSSSARTPAVLHCKKCFIVSICKGCQMKGVNDWHENSGECAALKNLLRAHREVFSPVCDDTDADANAEKNTSPHASNDYSSCNANGRGSGNKDFMVTMDMANEVDSSYILTVRIMIRRWSDCNLKISSPLPALEWSLLDQLYTAEMGQAGSDERRYYDAAISKLCQRMKLIDEVENLEQNENKTNDHKASSDSESDCRNRSWLTKDCFDTVMGKVVGCGHAVTDVTASLGCQCVGRSLFLEHSFYNHSCAPNAFLSCHIQTDTTKDDRNDENVHQDHQCALTARVHCIRDLEKNDPVTISYIPTSGLDRKERRQRLYKNYSFTCKCEACNEGTALGKRLNECLSLPDDCDIDILRQMQFGCNGKLSEIQKALALLDIDLEGDSESNLEKKEQTMNALQACISTIKMNQRGMKYQNIPSSHEVSIEAHRLLATSLSLAGDYGSAVDEHELFFKEVQNIQEIFDPVALATSLLEYANDLQRYDADKEGGEKRSSILSIAHENASTALGRDHFFVREGFEVFKGGKRSMGIKNITNPATKRCKVAQH